MKKHLTTIISVVSCVVTVMCLFRINDLQNQVKNFEWQISQLENNIRNEINGISYEVETALEQQASLITDSGWDWQDLKDADIKNNKILVDVYVTAKEYNPDTTQAVIFCNDTPHPMTLENGQFVAQLEVPVFTDSYINMVQFTNNGTVRTERLDWYIDAKDQLVPQFYADGPGYSVNWNSDGALVKFDGTSMVHVNHFGIEYNKKAHFYIVADSKEVFRNTISLTNSLSGSSDMDIYDVTIKGDVVLGYGSKVETWMEFTDSNGFIYRVLMTNFTLSEDKDILHPDFYRDGADIYAPDGTPVFLNNWYD